MSSVDGFVGGRVRPLIWDLDGTVVDSFLAVKASVDRALAEHGLPPVAGEALRSRIGLSLGTIFSQITGNGDQELLSALVTAYRRAFLSDGVAQTVLFPGVGELLGELAAAGAVSAIATSKARGGVDAVLDHLRIAGYFSCVVCDDDVVHKKPSPDMVLAVCSRLAADPADALVIGDTVFDIYMGKQAGTVTSAVAWGNQGAEQLAAARPDHFLRTPAELAAVVRMHTRP